MDLRQRVIGKSDYMCINITTEMTESTDYFMAGEIGLWMTY